MVGMSGEESTQWRYGIELTERQEIARPRSTVLTKALNHELDKTLARQRGTRTMRSSALGRAGGSRRSLARGGRPRHGLPGSDDDSINSVNTLEDPSPSSVLSSPTKPSQRASRGATPWQSVIVGGREVVMESPVVLGGGGGGGNAFRKRVTTDAYERASVGKTKCALCNLYFKSDSVKGTTCNKHVSAFRSLRGARVVGRRFETASFLYQEAKLCVFCTQLLGTQDDQLAREAKERDRKLHGVKADVQTALEDVISSETRLNALIESNVEADEAVAVNNVALKKPAWQSTTVDGRGADVAVDGDDAVGVEHASCTRREYEAGPEKGDFDSSV